MSKEPKLKGHSQRRSSPYPLGELPSSLAIKIGEQIVHRLAVGHADITGDDFGGIFADAIGGTHRGKPLGIADVIWQNCAWLVKTVKDSNPFEQERIRVISGRNDINYSFKIKDPFADVQLTGRSVLEIWNARVNESLNEHDDLRIFVMVRNLERLEFTLMEYAAERFVASNFTWKVNTNDNFEGYDVQTGEHCFTWQAGGRQFTVMHRVPNSAYRFKINRHVPIIAAHQVLATIGFDQSWITPMLANGMINIHPKPCV